LLAEQKPDEYKYHSKPVAVSDKHYSLARIAGCSIPNYPDAESVERIEGQIKSPEKCQHNLKFFLDLIKEVS